MSKDKISPSEKIESLVSTVGMTIMLEAVIDKMPLDDMLQGHEVMSKLVKDFERLVSTADEGGAPRAALQIALDYHKKVLVKLEEAISTSAPTSIN